MRFKDAAFEILKKAGKHLLYAEITDAALANGLACSLKTQFGIIIGNQAT